MPPTRQPAQVETVDPQAPRDPSQGKTTTMADLGMVARPEIEIDTVTRQAPRQTAPRMVTIRVNTDIEEMTYIQGGRSEKYSFETGRRYQVPIYIAQELEALGKIWH